MRIKVTAARAASVGMIAAASATFVGSPAWAAHPGSDHRPARRSGVVFAQSDNLHHNTVTAYDRGSDGSLTRRGTYSTGGRGGKLQGAEVDNLGSQGSLTYDRAHRLLYAVNAGSDTITVFGVDGDRLVRRQVLPSGGRFPVSVTVHGDVAYVLNARRGGSVQGYRRVGGVLLRIPTWHRTLGLDPDASPEFTHTPGQVQFTPDGRRLVVTTKSNSDSIVVFDVDRLGGLPSTPTTTTAPGTDPFGFTFDGAGRILATEGVPNSVATYQWAPGGRLTRTGDVATGQQATCWIVRNGQYVYVGNAGSATISEYREDRQGRLTSVGVASTHPGSVDLAVSSDGGYLYAQTGGMGLVDAFRVNQDGTLTKVGSADIPGALGGQGIAAS
ncbi:lactonase family protein [Actinopolymorpha pittospori]|uniref:6-phosphogluconolactonase (Cycloisomerase 2 family) n=1 Tax=Actinopolymorpha pittospori TaxID=648752 RepID=A0A927MQ54_9ACTN|nr:beta-propeller fold lactonase family protein [Actinopolymorpha pittospori]MBE1604629.1 6-phosphogluconolactonase (cycloisomerase 2 family) [Actinopolymorpha pittospori]